MKNETNRWGLDQPAIYRIQVRGALGEDWAGWFEGMTITVEDGITTLAGPVADQPALHGLLVRIRDLGLTLLSVEREDVAARTKRAKDNGCLDEKEE